MIDPTWETEAQMTEQMDVAAGAQVCWYGRDDKTIEARVDPTEWGHKAFVFERRGDYWTLVESYESVTVN